MRLNVDINIKSCISEHVHCRYANFSLTSLTLSLTIGSCLMHLLSYILFLLNTFYVYIFTFLILNISDNYLIGQWLTVQLSLVRVYLYKWLKVYFRPLYDDTYILILNTYLYTVLLTLFSFQLVCHLLLHKSNARDTNTVWAHNCPQTQNPPRGCKHKPKIRYPSRVWSWGEIVLSYYNNSAAINSMWSK